MAATRKMFGVRCSPEDHERVAKLAEAEGRTVSSFCGRIIMARVAELEAQEAREHPPLKPPTVRKKSP